MLGDPHKIGRYEVIRVIARSNDVVYEAYDALMRRRVAIKQLLVDRSGSPADVRVREERFEREARVLAQLAHPNIVQVYDVGQDGGAPFIVMELIEAPTLGQRIAIGAIPSDDAKSIAIQLLVALECAHSKGIIHRDVKPHNIFLTGDGALKLADFGISSVASEQTLGATGEVLGTASYLSPQQIKGIRPDPRDDLWAVGIVLFEGLSGVRPFQGSNALEIMHRISHDDPAWPPLISKPWKLVIERAIRKDQDDRFLSAREMICAIEANVPSVRQGQPPVIGQRVVQSQRSTSQAQIVVGPAPVQHSAGGTPVVLGQIILAPDPPAAPLGPPGTAPPKSYSTPTAALTSHPKAASAPDPPARRSLWQMELNPSRVLSALFWVFVVVWFVAQYMSFASPSEQAKRRRAYGYSDANVGQDFSATSKALLNRKDTSEDPPPRVDVSTPSTESSADPAPVATPSAVGGKLLSKRGNVEMVLIPEGEFVMGGNQGDEVPQRKVYLDAYVISKNDVTVGQFKTYCADVKVDFSKFETPPWGWIDDHPMVNVNWQEALNYCKWAGGDLPTEAQWEKAARGTDGREYPWGSDFDPGRLWCSKAEHGDAKSDARTGSIPSGASPFGCLDMAGNVGQWCLDWYAESYAGQPDRNPTGPDLGVTRVLRGGNWFSYDPAQFRCAFRSTLNPAYSSASLGFRLACSP